MTFKPALWHPIAVVLSGINLVATGFAAAAAEPWHAGIHAALTLASGLWAQRLWQRRGGSPHEARLDEFANELSNLRGELSEAQERMDFVERLLARESDTLNPEQRIR